MGYKVYLRTKKEATKRARKVSQQSGYRWKPHKAEGGWIVIPTKKKVRGVKRRPVAFVKPIPRSPSKRRKLASLIARGLATAGAGARVIITEAKKEHKRKKRVKIKIGTSKRRKRKRKRRR